MPNKTENNIAITHGDYKSNLGYPKGIQIWTAQTKAWKTITIADYHKIIGWMEE